MLYMSVVIGSVMPIILIIALIAAGGGISYKAESAVPGDVLYGVKTQIDEPVQRFFSLSPEARVSASADQAGERLGEAEQLASQGLLDTATKSSLDAAFKEKSDEAVTGMKQLAASGDPAAALSEATDFRKILEQHQVGLSDAYAAQTDSASLAADMSATVAVALGNAEAMQTSATALAQASGQSLPSIAESSDVGAPAAGGPIPDASASDSYLFASSTDGSTTTPDSIGSVILTLLSKVI